MTYKREIEKLVRKWQGILGLQNWRISVSVDPRLQPGSNDMANVWHHPAKMEAVISVRPQAELDADGSFLEPLVIHELLHLIFVYMDSKTPRHPAHDLLLEQRVEAMTRAFCEVGKIPFGKVRFL